MGVILYNCPLLSLSDGIISFIQFLFKNPAITPSEYRWNSDDRATKIFVSGPFTVSRDKVGALPTITVSRSGFNFENRVIDNLKDGSANVFNNKEYLDLMDGGVSITCEAGTEAEAVSIASFIGLELHANRHELRQQIKMLHRILRVAIGQAIPVKEEAEIVRWQCVVNFSVTLYNGWMKREQVTTQWNKMAIYNGNDQWSSSYGEYVQGADLFIDNSADFGFLSTCNPQILQSEYEKKWYFININEDPKKYTVEEIINNKTLRLSQIDADGNTIPFEPPTSQTNVRYKLFWNSVHISIELKK